MIDPNERERISCGVFYEVVNGRYQLSTNRDLYRWLASRLYSIVPAEVTAYQRRYVKGLMFYALYSTGASISGYNPDLAIVDDVTGCGKQSVMWFF